MAVAITVTEENSGTFNLSSALLLPAFVFGRNAEKRCKHPVVSADSHWLTRLFL